MRGLAYAFTVKRFRESRAPATIARLLRSDRALVRRRRAALLALVRLAVCLHCGIVSIQLAQAVESSAASIAEAPGLDTSEASLESQRREFLQAERALRRGRREQYLLLRERLRHYPLYPYLVYAELLPRLASADAGEVNAFIGEWHETPLSDRVRVRWLELLARRGEWSEYARLYRPVRQTRLQCLYLRALLETGRVDAAMERAPELWLVGTSQPEACDPAFEAWIRAGGVTRERAWQRVRLAFEAGQPGLARYLRRFLSVEDRQLLEKWLSVNARPERVTSAVEAGAEREIVEDILVYGVHRLARRNPDLAVTAWNSLQAQFPFTDEARNAVLTRLALAYAYRHRPEAEQWFERLPEEGLGPRAAQWRVLDGLRRRDWPGVLEAIEGLDVEHRTRPRWEYWRARALDELGMAQSAEAVFRGLANGRGYYSFLAADNLDQVYELSDRPLPFTDAELTDLANRPAARRAHELYRLARRTQARREWRLLTEELEDRDLARAAKLAANWGWHGRAILTLGRTSYRDDLALRFPLAYHKEILRFSSAREIEPAWLFAVVRQESAFMPDARSHAGALGLMQIMPDTARVLTRSSTAGPVTRDQLLDVETSLSLGSGYLRQLLDRLDQHPALAAAAYNAGKHRVDRWRPSGEALPADIWIETVPFTETREYLKRVMAYTVIYEWRLGLEPQRLSQRLVPVRPRSQRVDARAQSRAAPLRSGG